MPRLFVALRPPEPVLDALLDAMGGIDGARWQDDEQLHCTLAFLGLFTFGGLTGLFLGSLATDVHVNNTYFIVAHFHYVMVGSVLFSPSTNSLAR